MNHAVVVVRVRQRYDPAADMAVDPAEQNNVLIIPGITEEKFIPLGIPHPLRTDRRVHGKSDTERESKQTADIQKRLLPQPLRKSQQTGAAKIRRRDQHAGL